MNRTIKKTFLDFTHQHAHCLMMLVSLAIVSVFMMLSLAAFPAADDFCYAVKVRKLGFIATQAEWYRTWTGRYSATALISAISLAKDITRNYCRVLIAAQLAMLAGFFFFFHGLLKPRFTFGRILVITLSGYVVFLTGLPDTGQYLFWTMGIADYGSGNLALLLLMAMAVRRERGRGGRISSLCLFMTAALFVVIAVGTNEVTMASVIAILAGGFFLAIRRKSGSVRFWAGLLAVAVLGAAVSVLAPGNFSRVHTLANDGIVRPPGLLAAGLFLPWFMLRAAYWLANPAIWASAFIALMANRDLACRVLYRDNVFRKNWLLFPPLWATLILGLTGMGFIINHYPLPERAESCVWFVFLAGWYPSFIILFHFFQYISGDGATELTETAKKIAVIALLLSLIGSPVIMEAFKDSYRGLRYWREMRARMSCIEKHRGDASVDLEVPSLSRPPRTLFTTEITTDPNNFRNSCLAEYYGLRSIALGNNKADVPLPDDATIRTSPRHR